MRKRLNPQSSRKEKESRLNRSETDLPPEKPLQKSPKTDQNPEKPQKINKKVPENPQPLRKILIILSIVLFLIGAILGALLYFFLYLPSKPISHLELKKPAEEETEEIYSILTGEKISDEKENSSPTYCVQIPNGLDGARSQSGLNEASIVFEAIAEYGITRFAAIYQNPTSIIGPLRSLRIYYLNWDHPFDCTIVHAGGSGDALAALATGGYRDLTENYSYMWRTNANSVQNRLWNNLWTSSANLETWATDRGLTSSNPTSFERKSPSDSEKSRILTLSTNPLDIDVSTDTSVSALAPKISHITFDLSGYPSFNPVYDYDPSTNSYKRSYASGEPHISYNCPATLGEATPELSCESSQISPKVVIALIVEEGKAADNYHEDISVIGSGRAYIFENGDYIDAIWKKPTKESQITFRSASGEKIPLAPGTTWLTAVPAYGSVSYE